MWRKLYKLNWLLGVYSTADCSASPQYVHVSGRFPGPREGGERAKFPLFAYALNCP